MKKQALLADGGFSATYKYALLHAIADLCVDSEPAADGSLTLTVDRLAGKFIELYWRQTSIFPLGPGAGDRVLIEERLVGEEASYYAISDGEQVVTLAAAQEAGAVTINYGVFVNNIISFLIVAFAVFLLIKAMNAAKAKAADLKGNDAEVYDSAITAVGDAIADSGQMNSDIMAILLTIRAGNPYK